MIKKTSIFILLFLFVSTLCFSETSSIERFLTGNWYRNEKPQNTVTQEYGWGKGETVINFTIEIDLMSNEGQILLPMIGGPFLVKDAQMINDSLCRLTFFFDRGGFDVTYLIHKQEKAIWFELDTDLDLSFIPTGPDFTWYKIAGPSI